MRGEEGVSPIIGAILLVAVVVVTGAAMFVLTQAYGEDQDVAPQPTWTFDDNQDRILIARAPEAVDWSRFSIIADKPIHFALNTDPTMGSTALTPGEAEPMPAAAMSAGDEVRLCGDGGTQTDLKVWFVDPHLEQQVSGFMKFRIVAGCPP